MSKLFELCNDPKMLELFANNNFIFHYTKRRTALEHILKNSELKFSPRKKANDPFEHSIFNISSKNAFWDFFGKAKKTFSLELLETQRLEKNIFRAINHETTQLSFCRNDNRLMPTSHEYYGFLKPRMWAQYGDNFKGVCLAFDKNILIKESGSLNAKIFAGEIVYSNFEEFYSRDIHVDTFSASVTHNRYEAYCDAALKHSIDYALLKKHRDYEHENEFRIIKVSSQNDDTFRFTESLRGIVFNPRYFMKSKFRFLRGFAERHNIPLIGIQWDANQVQVYVETQLA